MNILIVGAGITGCTFANILAKTGRHRIRLLEANDYVGGLCATGVTDGIYHDKFGPHIFRSDDDNIISFVEPYLQLNHTNHFVGTYINGRLFDWPISEDDVEVLENIFGCRIQRSGDYFENPKNFEEAAINAFGPILYNLFVSSYTRNMWHCEPRTLDTSFAPRVLKINSNDKRYFKNTYQGWPKNGYTSAINRLIKYEPKISLSLCCPFQPITYNQWADLIIYTGSIDTKFIYKFGKLPYVGMTFENKIVERNDFEPIELYRYPTINYPNCEFGYIRQTAYRGLTRQLHPKGREVIGYEYPNRISSTHPVRSEDSKDQLRRYLKHSSEFSNFMPAGRLGLFKYLSMNEAIGLAMKMAGYLEDWSSYGYTRRYEYLCDFASIEP